MSNPRTGAPKRVAVGLLAGALAVFGVALAPTASAADAVTTERLAGANRYGTAAAIAADEAFAAPTTAIVATGENFPDALAASTLAGANAPAPIILTQTATYTAEAKAALAALKGKGVSAVTIVGGTVAVAQSVEDAIKADGFTVTRTAGADRYATAAAIATAANAKAPADPVGGLDTALIATGLNFPDALAGGPAGYAAGLPLLLVSDVVPQATKDALIALGVKKAIVLGGTAAVSPAVEAELATSTGNPVTRLAGVNRFGTAAAVGDYEQDTLGFAATSAILATGNNFPDALAAGPLGGQLEAPIVLTSSVPAETCAALDKWSDSVAKLYASGGTAVIDDATLEAAKTCAQTTDNDPARAGASQTSSLVGPELQNVRISDFELDFDDLSIEYTFEFDTPIDDDDFDESKFHIYNADTQIIATGDFDDGDASGSSVAVWFDLKDDGVSDGVLAAVENGAVTDEEGNPNPPQSVSINPLAGKGGGLIDIEITNEDDGIVTFVFSSNQYPEALDGPQYTFNLVDDEGNVYTRSSASADAENVPEDDEASPEVEVTFEELADDNDDILTPFELNDIVRGYILNFAGFPDIIVQNVDISDGGDVTDTPDLDGVELPTSNSDLNDDEVLFSFDEEIDTADGSLFHLYYGVAGSGISDGEEEVEIDGKDVIVTFTDEAVNELISGAFIDDGAVESNADTTDEEDPCAGCVPNLTDGELIDYAAKAGEVLGPQLDSVELREESDSFGDFEEFQVVFTFNKDLVEDDDIPGFSIWSNDGEDVDEIALDNCDTDNNVVTCTDDDDESDIAEGVVASVEYGAVFSEDETDLGNGSDSFPNPEASFEVSLEQTTA